MATITSASSGNWSSGSVWVGGVAPADNDAVVIASGHSVVFNVDTSAWANGISGITITGTLSVSTTTSSYMKMKAATTISGAGTFNVGTSGTPIPFAVKFTLTGGSGWYVQGSGGLTMGVYGAEPTYKYVKLTGAESAGATRLEVDTDLTGDIWAVNDVIHINNINNAKQSEERTISAITSTYIDISAGITNSKLSGSFVILIYRNVSIIGYGANVLQNFSSYKLNLNSGSYRSDNRVFTAVGSDVVISGGVFANNSHISAGGKGYFVSNSIVSNQQDMFYGPMTFGIAINNCIISGCTYLGYLLFDFFIDSSIVSGCTNVIYQSFGKINNTVFFGNQYDLRECVISSNNVAFNSSVENYLYSNFLRNTYSESIDHDQVAGALKAWTKGGVTTSVATPVPTGFTRSYQLAPENATVEGFFNRRVNVPAGKTITLTLYLRKSKAMTYLPRVWVHKYGTEPFTTPADILHTFTMTNSTDTWETDSYSWTNTADYDIELNCRFVAMNADGYMYGQVADTFAGGGGVSKSRIIGGV